jgi:acyl-CoA thioesterase-2
MAAGLTVPSDRHPHSMHGYFLRQGRRDQSVIFKVERDRDGRSFSARRVCAMQGGQVIFDLTASFHVDEEGKEFRVPMDVDTPSPDETKLERSPFDLRLAEVLNVPPGRIGVENLSVSPTMWVRIPEPLGENRLVHACALAFLSDLGSGFAHPDAAELPAGGPSLDHALWFQGQARADDWILLKLWPLMAGNARGLYLGSMHQCDGTLLAMLTQESLLRPFR